MNAQCSREPPTRTTAFGSRSRHLSENTKLLAVALYNLGSKSTVCAGSRSETSTSNVHQVGWTPSVAHSCTTSTSSHSFRHRDGRSSSFHSSGRSPGVLLVDWSESTSLPAASFHSILFAPSLRILLSRGFQGRLLRLQRYVWCVRERSTCVALLQTSFEF